MPLETMKTAGLTPYSLSPLVHLKTPIDYYKTPALLIAS